MTNGQPAPFKCPECNSARGTRRALAQHRSLSHGITAPAPGWQKPRRIYGVPAEVDMTCWCGGVTFRVPTAWIGVTAPSCDDDCYRRSTSDLEAQASPLPEPVTEP